MAKKLSKAGILWLASELVAHQKKYYQNRFIKYYKKGADEEFCGTVCCLSGFCYLDEIGARKFNKLAKDAIDIQTPAVAAGIKRLGLDFDIGPSGWSCPVIFMGLADWPKDLQEEYYSNGPRWRVIAALKALQRLLPDGSIDSNPKAVHTKIPALAKLLKEHKNG
jgi:hypothetical protein